MNFLKKLQFLFKKKEKVSVIIPVLNEEQSIGKVIDLVKKSKFTDEIIVIDDNSEDNTVEEAKKHGAKVFISAVRGKGYSMKEGLHYAKNNIIVYLDGDIGNYEEDIVEKLVHPILYEGYDFVKSTFDREAGRVTELVAKPLLGILFPNLLVFSQPLSGMIAGKKKILQKVNFENDYGVDIGILIDVFNIKAKIKEVYIGKIENKSKPWQQLGKMSSEVAKAILKRAADKNLLDFDGLQSINVIQNEMISTIQSSIINLKKMIIFNLYNVVIERDILKEFFIKKNLANEYIEILTKYNDYTIQKKLIAKLLKGINIDELINFIDSINISEDFYYVMKELKSRGYITGIVSSSFDMITEKIRKKLGMDFSLSNQLAIFDNTFSGEVLIPSYFINSTKSLCNHPVCKSNAIIYLSEKFKIKIQDIIYIGDSNEDICPIKISGVGIAYKPKTNLLSSISDLVIKSNIKEILKYTK
jgi:glycosyltransferase involved in cell wall biosynthesis